MFALPYPQEICNEKCMCQTVNSSRLVEHGYARVPCLAELSTDEYSSPSLPMGGTFQDPQYMRKTEDSTEPYMYHIFYSMYIPMIKFDL